MDDFLNKFEEIFLRYLPYQPYTLKYVYVYDWLILGDLKDAITLNTDAVLSVFNEADYYKEYFSNKEWCVIDIMDHSDENIEIHFEKAFEFLDTMEKQKKTCIVHCHAGINRSATIVLAYFIKKTGMNLFDAYEFLSLMRPGIIYNTGFRKQLISWAKKNNLL
jgi:protein-tyrosine phosphatase